MKFTPEKLKNDLIIAMKNICAYADDGGLFENSFNLVDDKFEYDEYEEEISENTEFKMYFPDYDGEINIKAKHIIELAGELTKTELIEDLECISDKKYLLKVGTDEYQSQVNLDACLSPDNTGGIEAGLNTFAIIELKHHKIRLLRGSALFRLLYAKQNSMHRESPPADFDYFIEITSDEKMNTETVNRILDSFLFELATSMKIRLNKTPLPLFKNEYDEDEEVLNKKLRPLLFGPGVEDVIKIYNNALESYDANVRILIFTKVFEYISQTILREQIFDKISNKLNSPSALNPDINYILELENLFDEHKFSKKDKQAITITILKCCDANELSKISPKFLIKMNESVSDSKEKDREQALKEFAEALVDTRNSIAHAKSNYTPTGKECPENEIFEFAECIKFAAEQAIRSFNRIPEYKRV